MINSPVITALNASTFVAVTLPKSSDHVFNDISLWTEDQTAWTFATDADGTDAAIIPANTPFSIGGYSDKSNILLYAKASAGTPNLITFFKASKI